MSNGSAEDPSRPPEHPDAPATAPTPLPAESPLTTAATTAAPASDAAAPTATVAAPPPAPAPKKRRTGCYVAGCLALLLFCCCVSSVIAVGLAMYSLSGTTNPKDLGVSYTEADFDKVVKDINLDFKPSADWTNPDVVTTYSGKQPIDYTFTNEAFSAFANYTHSARFPVEQLQVKFSEGGRAESSMLFYYAGRPYPVYLVGTIDSASGRTVDGTLTEVQVAGYTLPENYLETVAEILFAMINSRLARIEALNIESLEFTDGGVRLIGTIPQTAVRGPSTGTGIDGVDGTDGTGIGGTGTDGTGTDGGVVPATPGE